MGFFNWVKKAGRWLNNKILNPSMNTIRKLSHGAKNFVYNTLPQWVDKGKSWLRGNGLGFIADGAQKLYESPLGAPIRKGYQLAKQGVNWVDDKVNSADKILRNGQETANRTYYKGDPLDTSRQPDFIPESFKKFIGSQ